MNYVTRIESLEDVRPGDAMFGPIGEAVGAGIELAQIALGEGVRLGPLSVRHVGIVVEAATRTDAGVQPPLLAQAMPSGAEIVEMRTQTHWTPRHAYVRLPVDYPGQAENAAAIARAMVAAGVGYSFGSYAMLAAWHWGLKAKWLEERIDRRQSPVEVELPCGPFGSHRATLAFPVEAICSVFVDQAWSLAGKRVMHDVPRQVDTPGAMALQLWNREGALWGGPGIMR